MSWASLILLFSLRSGLGNVATSCYVRHYPDGKQSRPHLRLSPSMSVLQFSKNGPQTSTFALHSPCVRQGRKGVLLASSNFSLRLLRKATGPNLSISYALVIISGGFHHPLKRCMAFPVGRAEAPILLPDSLLFVPLGGIKLWR